MGPCNVLITNLIKQSLGLPVLWGTSGPHHCVVRLLFALELILLIKDFCSQNSCPVYESVVYLDPQKRSTLLYFCEDVFFLPRVCKPTKQDLFCQLRVSVLTKQLRFPTHEKNYETKYNLFLHGFRKW